MFGAWTLRVASLTVFAAATQFGVSCGFGQSTDGGGIASAISAKGSYNLSTSEAAINLTTAKKQEIQNRLDATNTYFAMRSVNRAATAAERRPNASMEQLARIARDSAPKPFGANDQDPVTGQVDWPEMLLIELYAPHRTVLDQLNADKAAAGRLSMRDQMKGRQEVEKMFSAMKTQIRVVPPQQYSASRTFLRSLIYALAQGDLH